MYIHRSSLPWSWLAVRKLQAAYKKRDVELIASCIYCIHISDIILILYEGCAFYFLIYGNLNYLGKKKDSEALIPAFWYRQESTLRDLDHVFERLDNFKTNAKPERPIYMPGGSLSTLFRFDLCLSQPFWALVITLALDIMKVFEAYIHKVSSQAREPHVTPNLHALNQLSFEIHSWSPARLQLLWHSSKQCIGIYKSWEATSIYAILHGKDWQANPRHFLIWVSCRLSDSAHLSTGTPVASFTKDSESGGTFECSICNTRIVIKGFTVKEVAHHATSAGHGVAFHVSFFPSLSSRTF